MQTISPGVTATDMSAKTNEHMENLGESPEIYELLKPEDVAKGILFILGSPAHVTIAELLMVPTGEKY